MATTKKQVFILRRYEIKQGTMAGCVCNIVRSIKAVKGEQVTHEYQVWRYADGVMSCNCDARGNCCHIKHVETVEAARNAAVVVTPVTPVVAKPEVTVLPVAETPAAVAEAKPVARMRKMSSVEASGPAWLMTGLTRNGYISGRKAS
jgi:hypothetical protein